MVAPPFRVTGPIANQTSATSASGKLAGTFWRVELGAEPPASCFSRLNLLGEYKPRSTTTCADRCVRTW